MKQLNLIYVRHNLHRRATQIAEAPIPFNDITVLIKGTLDYTVNGKRVTLNGGDVIFMPEGVIRSRAESPDNADYISFNFTSEDTPTLPLVLRDAVRGELRLLVAAFDEINRKSYLDNKEKYEHLLACSLSVLEDFVKEEDLNPLTQKIMSHIHEHLSEKITLDDIGKLTFFSPIYCDTVFKRETGKSIIDYLLDKRIEEAKKLLLEGMLNLRQISEVVGFGDYNYFSRVFKKRTGYSPTSYRNNVFSAIGIN